MLFINPNTKQAAAIRATVKRANTFTAYSYSNIFDAYQNPSIYKIRAWNNCEKLCKDLDGFNLRISGRNCMKFSVVFNYYDANNTLHYVWITPDYIRNTTDPTKEV